MMEWLWDTAPRNPYSLTFKIRLPINALWIRTHRTL
jgi:hypothetical protein